jgi:hypothetical protein
MGDDAVGPKSLRIEPARAQFVLRVLNQACRAPEEKGLRCRRIAMGQFLCPRVMPLDRRHPLPRLNRTAIVERQNAIVLCHATYPVVAIWSLTAPEYAIPPSAT